MSILNLSIQNVFLNYTQKYTEQSGFSPSCSLLMQIPAAAKPLVMKIPQCTFEMTDGDYPLQQFVAWRAEGSRGWGGGTAVQLHLRAATKDCGLAHN